MNMCKVCARCGVLVHSLMVNTPFNSNAEYERLIYQKKSMVIQMAEKCPDCRLMVAHVRTWTPSTGLTLQEYMDHGGFSGVMGNC